MSYAPQIVQNLALSARRVEAVLELLESGATIPFAPGFMFKGLQKPTGLFSQGKRIKILNSIERLVEFYRFKIYDYMI